MNASRQSPPFYEGGVQAFECQIPLTESRIYITVERQNDRLLYHCFRDEEIWARSHDEHEACRGCLEGCLDALHE
jgi:hypothetical protein